MRITYQGRDLTALSVSEYESISSALGILGALLEDDPTGFTVSESCRAFAIETDNLAAETISADFIALGNIPVNELNDVSAIPRNEWGTEGDFGRWAADPVLSQALRYPGGLLVPTEDVAALRQIVRNVTALERGDCEPRTITAWGLVGALGLAVGGAVLLGGLFTSQGRKR